VHSFFAESENPIIRQFVQTGSISLPAPDAKPEELAEHIPPPPPLPAAAAAAVQSFQAVAPYLQTSRYGVQTVADIGVYTNAFDARAPRGFVWVIPGLLAGCPQPGISNPIEYDLQLLARVGVTVLVTLTEEDLEQAPLREAGLRNLHLPVYDRGVPSMRQIYMLLHRMMRLLEQGDVLAIHCLAGLGRTGTVLAAWMIKEGGLTASEAIRRLRLLQPGFIQSAEQEAFLFNFEKDLIHRTL
jgi:atypical dual specificity phosphatase